MLLQVFVESPDAFQAWASAQKASDTQTSFTQVAATHGENEISGKRIFETTACVNCHTVAGTPATGRFGPDLTHLMSRRTIAAGAAKNTADNLRLWIENPGAIKPGSLMPAMQLSKTDLDALVRYLETLR
jgi:cytochrome c oxidase subunit 2